MDYWDEVMQDDVYLIADDGWIQAVKPRGIIHDKEKKIEETPDLTLKRRKYKMDLIPPELIVARYFAADQVNIDALQNAYETAISKLAEFVEENTSEDGLLQDATNDKGKVTKTAVTKLLKIIQDEPDSDEERDALTRCCGSDRKRIQGDQGCEGQTVRVGPKSACPLCNADRG